MLQKDNLLCKYCGSNFNEESHVPRIIPQCGHCICEQCLIQKYNGVRKLLMCKIDRQIISLKKTDIDDFEIDIEMLQQLSSNQDQQKTRVKNEIKNFEDANQIRYQSEELSQKKLNKKLFKKRNTDQDLDHSQESEFDRYESDESYQEEVAQIKNNQTENDVKENPELRDTVDETNYLLQNLRFAFEQNVGKKEQKEQIKIDPRQLKEFEEYIKKEQEQLKKYDQDVPECIAKNIDQENQQSSENSEVEQENEYTPQKKLSTLQTFERAGVFKDSLQSTVSFANRNRFTLQDDQQNFPQKTSSPPQQQNPCDFDNTKKQIPHTISISLNGMCWIHKNIQQQIFCIQCKTKICYQCAFEQHKNHQTKQIQLIQVEVEDYQQNLNKILSDVENREQQQNKQLTIQKLKDIVNQKKEQFFDQIENFVSEQTRKIQEFGKNAKNDMELLLEQKQKESEEMIQKCDTESEQKLGTMKRNLKSIQNSINNHTDVVEKYIQISKQQSVQFAQCSLVVDTIRNYVSRIQNISKEKITSLQLKLSLNGDYKQLVEIRKPQDIMEQTDKVAFQDQFSPIQNLDQQIMNQQKSDIKMFDRQKSQPQINPQNKLLNQQNSLQVYDWKDNSKFNNTNQYKNLYKNNLYTKSQKNLSNSQNFQLTGQSLRQQNFNQKQNQKQDTNELNDSDSKSNKTTEDLLQELGVNEEHDNQKVIQNMKQMQNYQKKKRFEKSLSRKNQNFISHNTSLNQLHENKRNFQQQKITQNQMNQSNHNLSRISMDRRNTNQRENSSRLNKNNISRISNTNRDQQIIYNRPFRKQQSEANLNLRSNKKEKSNFQNESLNKSINRKLSNTQLQKSMEFNRQKQNNMCNLYSSNRKYLNLNKIDQQQINTVLNLEKKNVSDIKRHLRNQMNQKNVYQVNLAQISKLKRCQSWITANYIQTIKRL